MIKRPPKDIESNPFSKIVGIDSDHLSSYLELHSPIDHKGRYLHFDNFRFRVPSELDVSLAWSVVKMARQRQLTSLLSIGDPVQSCKFMLTPTIQKAISETDRNATSAALEWMSSKIGEEKYTEYLLNDLIEDEAISSSQLEGAATTTKVAKDLLKRKRKPRTPDEKMILGNYKMMHYAWESRNKKLSLDFITELHTVGMEGIDDEKYHPGVFRNTNDVEVVDGDGNTVHTPPPFRGLSKRLKKLIKWINDCNHNADSYKYIHPLVKAIILHFCIGFEHPFRDGNGRVARALFYWYLFKNDYAAFRYIAISVLLKKAPAKYGKSYLYTESDEMDLTYFVDYQCSIILRSINNFKETYRRSLDNIEIFNRWLWDSGLYRKLNDKQRTIFQIAKSNNNTHFFTSTNVKEGLGCSYNTASNILNGLVNLGLFKKIKQGREWHFSIRKMENIMHVSSGQV
jgi:Fic family protein